MSWWHPVYTTPHPMSSVKCLSWAAWAKHVLKGDTWIISVVNEASAVAHGICWLCLKHPNLSLLAIKSKHFCMDIANHKTIKKKKKAKATFPFIGSDTYLWKLPDWHNVDLAVGPAEVKSLLCVTVVVEELPLKSSSTSAKYHLSCTCMGFKCACQSLDG